MPKILNKDNFTVADLQYLYKGIVIDTFNNSHSANNNDRDIFNFFDHKVKLYFRPIIDSYDGVKYFQKILTVIEEIRGKILTNILISLDDSSSTNLLGHIDSTIKANIKKLIKGHKNSLQAMQFNCAFCDEFRGLINQILGNINKTSINQLNTDPLLGAWRFLDPENNRRMCEQDDFNAPYINNPFSLSSHTTRKLLSCGTDVESFTGGIIYGYGGYVFEATAIYYLATKFSHIGTAVAEEEQERRFIAYATTLTEALRGYNEGNSQGVDSPSCPGGIIGRFIEQGGYEQNLQFISKRTFINDVISDVVCKRVHEILTISTTTQEVTHLLSSLSAGFSQPEQLSTLETTPELRKKRYSLFNVHNNNKTFFELIKQNIKEKRDNIGNAVIVDFHQNIQGYSYQDFENIFLGLSIVHTDGGAGAFTREFRLIGYTFSDPTYCCYSKVFNMCSAKSKQLQPQLLIISGETAIKLCEEVVAEVLPLIADQPLFANGFWQADLAIIIESYKNGINSRESDPDFIDRIRKINYHDLDEFGKEEEVAGLSKIINTSLVNSNILINNIARKILKRIRKHLKLGQEEERDPLLEEEPYQISLDVMPEGYDIENEASLGNTIDYNLQQIRARTCLEHRIRYVFGVRNVVSVGPYSNVLDFPNVPVVHPYVPNGIGNIQSYDAGVPSFPIVVNIPGGTISNLPSGVKEQLIRHKININQLEVFFCVQNMPWRQDEQLLLRPHPWLHQDAPFNGNYIKNDIVLAGTMAVNSRIESLTEFAVSTHHNEIREIVYSPDNMHIQGIDSLDKSHAFYSFLIVKSTGKAVLTLHWLLSPTDYLRITTRLIGEVIANRNGVLRLANVVDWAAHIRGSNLNGGFDEEAQHQELGRAGNDMTAVDALQRLIVGGQPEVSVDNGKYRLVGQQVVVNYYQQACLHPVTVGVSRTFIPPLNEEPQQTVTVLPAVIINNLVRIGGL